MQIITARPSETIDSTPSLRLLNPTTKSLTAPNPAQNKGWTARIAGCGHPLVTEAQRLQRRVYEQAGFLDDATIFNNNGVIIDRWSQAAHHIALHDSEGPVGHLRLIDRSTGPLQTETIWPDLKLPTACMEISALAIDRVRARPFDTVKWLYREAFRYAIDQGCTHLVATLEQTMLRILSKRLRFPVETIGSPIWYMGGITVPAMVSIADTRKQMSIGEVDPWFGRSELAAA